MLSGSMRAGVCDTHTHTLSGRVLFGFRGRVYGKAAVPLEFGGHCARLAASARAVRRRTDW